MDQDQLVAIVERSGIAYQPGTRQKQLNQVRFFGPESRHSLNLGYTAGAFVADFVFKADDRKTNVSRCQAFLEPFAGELRQDRTIFARITVPFGKEDQLIQMIQNYWGLDL